MNCFPKITGATGPTGPSFIRQPFANLNVSEQSIAHNSAVTYVFPTISGVGFNGTNTFTVITPGIYILECVLNLATGNATGNEFAISINNNIVDTVAPAANAANTDPIMIIRVQYYQANTTVRIINQSGHNIRLANGNNSTSSAGHFVFCRIADGILT